MSAVKRVENIQNAMEKMGVDVLLIDDSTSIYYLTNLQMSAGILLIAKKEIQLLVDGRYFAVAEKHSPFPVGPLEASMIEEFFAAHGSNLSKKIGFNSQKTSYNSFQKLSELVHKVKERKKVIDFQLVPINNPLKSFMALKDSSEIQKMKQAALLTWRAFQHICTFLQVGISEEEVALEFEIFCRKNGASAMAFPPIIAFGQNTAYPHHISGRTSLRENEEVLIDIGVILDHYCSDMTRMIFLGEYSKEVEALYLLVKKAHQKALSLCRPGVCLSELDVQVRKVFAEQGMDHLFPHSLGHGVGLQVHEYPRISLDGDDKDVVLQPGMIVTIEPGLYDPKIGGARYEDMILITQNGYENFFSSV